MSFARSDASPSASRRVNSSVGPLRIHKIVELSVEKQGEAKRTLNGHVEQAAQQANAPDPLERTSHVRRVRGRVIGGVGRLR